MNYTIFKIIIVFLAFNSIWAFSQETNKVLMNDAKNISNSQYQYIFSGSANFPDINPKDEENNGKDDYSETDYKSGLCPIQEINRTIDGECNNIATNGSADFGMAGIQLLRTIPDVYNANSDLVGQNRKNPREISNLVFQMNGEAPSGSLSSFVFTWGQFLDHDITLTPTNPNETANIPPLPGDIIIGAFNRSAFLPGTGVNGIPREQLNENTAWIDASGVYGSDTPKANSLRTFVNGKMKTSIGNNGEEILPIIGGQFLAGDERALEQPGLTSLHVLFLREHNRICDKLMACGLTNDEVIYQKARKQVGALIQSITYNEFLPALGVQLPNYNGYNNTIQPDITNVFATAAYRLGHTMVTDNLLLFDDNGNNTGTFSLSQVFFNQNFISNNGIEGVFNGLAQQFQEEVDAKMVESLRSFLFPNPSGEGLDLAALNIQRGRDHGLDDYNAYRTAFGIPAANNFSDITSDPTLQNQLSTAYNNDVNNIDVWVGLLAEDHLAGSSLGPTLNTILSSQFTSLRNGDFYFYENDPGLTAIEKTIIQNTRLSDIIKRNTNIENIKADVFYGPCSYANLSQGCVFDTGDCGCEKWEICNNGYCEPNSDPDACCTVSFDIINHGSCPVDIVLWAPTGDVYITTIAPGDFYWTNTYEGEKWIAIGYGNYMITGCENQTFHIYDIHPNSDPDACCVGFDIINHGSCPVDIWLWTPTGDVFITTIPPGGFYWTNTYEGAKWIATGYGNYMITGCNNQTFHIYSDSDACCVALTVNNHGDCSVDFKYWTPQGDFYVTTLNPGDSYTVYNHEGEKYFVTPPYEDYMITGCEDQTFDVYPCSTGNCPSYDNITQTISGTSNYNVANEITASNIIQPTANVTYVAGNKIRLLPNFRASDGCNFHAYIAACSTSKTDANSNDGENSYQNPSLTIFPNPVNDVTNIVYELPKESVINIVIYDLIGRQIAVLEDQTLKAKGKHELQFDATDLPSGIYHINVQAEAYNASQKLVIRR